MPSIGDRIMRRVWAKGRGEWVCTSADFLAFGGRPAIGRALARLAKSGKLRRVWRGLYDLPRFSRVWNRFGAVDIGYAINAIVRRDGIRIMRGGGLHANLLRVTNNVPAKFWYVTDGRTRKANICGATVYFEHASPKMMSWKGKISESAAMALYWLGPYASQDPSVAPTLRSVLPRQVKDDLVRHRHNLPAWGAEIALRIAAA